MQTINKTSVCRNYMRSHLITADAIIIIIIMYFIKLCQNADGSLYNM